MSKVEVNATYLAELEKANRKLKALEQGGVDNWEWYSESLKHFFKEEEQEEILELAINDILEFLCVEADIYEPSERGAGYTIRLNSNEHLRFTKVIRDIILKYNEAGEDE